jgi:hypothetical protein
VNHHQWPGTIRPWLRDAHAPAFEAALDWLLPRCRTEEERVLAPALLLLLSPLNALVTPCRPVSGSRVNFQITLSRHGDAGPQRVRLTVRVQPGAPASRRSGVLKSELGTPDEAASERLELILAPQTVIADPLGSAAQVLGALLRS